jgi:hypothetical protein
MFYENGKCDANRVCGSKCWLIQLRVLTKRQTCRKTGTQSLRASFGRQPGCRKGVIPSVFRPIFQT